MGVLDLEAAAAVTEAAAASRGAVTAAAAPGIRQAAADTAGRVRVRNLHTVRFHGGDPTKKSDNFNLTRAASNKSSLNQGQNRPQKQAK